MFSYFEKLVNPFPAEHPVKPPKGIYQFCRHYTRGIEPVLIVMSCLTAVAAIGEAMLFGILGQVVDWLATKNTQAFLEEEWQTLVIMTVFILVFMPVIATLQSLVVHQALMGNFPMLVRWLSHRYLLGQSYSFFQNEFSGRIATKVMQTSLAVRESVMKMLDVMLFVIVYLATTLLLVANADIRLSLPLIVWVILYVVVLKFFIPRLQTIAMNQADARSTMTGRIVDSYTNIITIKLFSHTAREEDYVREGMSEFMATVHPQMRLVTLLNASVWFINMSLVFVVGALGIYLWLQDAITPGAIAIALSLAIRLTGMAHWIMWEVSNLFENIGTVQDGINTLSESNIIEDNNDSGQLTVKQGNIRFDHVNFAYNDSTPVFNDLNLAITPGERIGIVGRSGAGKSTLVNLLLRFYDIQNGRIEVDGMDIRQVDQESLRANIAMVTQDTSLLHRSVRENIMFGNPDATEEQMRAAAVQAQADHFIHELRDVNGRVGYDAHVGERGVTLSGGQRQRIAIARVLLKDAPILILDEATSALDSEVETSIQQNLNQLMEGKTVIAIAHRLSTIAAMDRLIVLDGGNILEQGTHSDLLNYNGLYAHLWHHQSGGFLGEE